jgi:hypothetical protein
MVVSTRRILRSCLPRIQPDCSSKTAPKVAYTLSRMAPGSSVIFAGKRPGTSPSTSMSTSWPH